MKSVFIIDDEKEICESLKMILEYEDYQVDYSTHSKEAIEILKEKQPDVLLLDIQMPEMNGFEILNRLKENMIDIKTIMISAHSSLENAIKATKLGAFDFVEKPIDREKLLISVRNAATQNQLIIENQKLKSAIGADENIIGESMAIKNILMTVERVAPTDARVFITGENGTGKELIARAVYKRSTRSHKNFVEVNCAAIPNELIESELFGHEKGSFTGAFQQRIGKFELANNGILFLDEIGDMSMNAQAKVLRAIEDGIIERVGGNKKISVDVRILSATNKDLKEEIKGGRFREDLFHRLNVIPIHIPPLRERKDDIPVLVNHFVNQICLKNNFPLKKFTSAGIKTLQSFEWTGNIRELRNFIERIIIMIPHTEIGEKEIESLMPKSSSGMKEILDISNSFQDFKEKSEKAFIERQLELNNWNISKTAEVLDIQRSHLYSKIKKYGLEKGQ
jgi:two-component system, NtrC family, nitrogen regulation response regulator NtrX